MCLYLLICADVKDLDQALELVAQHRIPDAHDHELREPRIYALDAPNHDVTHRRDTARRAAANTSSRRRDHRVARRRRRSSTIISYRRNLDFPATRRKHATIQRVRAQPRRCGCACAQ